jgi:hypothetical protein
MKIHRNTAYASSARHTLKVCSEYYKYSTGAPLVTRTMSRSSHVRCGMSTSGAEIADAGHRSFVHPDFYVSPQGVTSGDLPGQVLGPAAGLGNADSELRARSSSSVVVHHLAGRTLRAAVRVKCG